VRTQPIVSHSCEGSGAELSHWRQDSRGVCLTTTVCWGQGDRSIFDLTSTDFDHALRRCLTESDVDDPLEANVEDGMTPNSPPYIHAPGDFPRDWVSALAIK
jgi:hypothetical protein